MKGYQRREAGIVATFNLDVWDHLRCCWLKTKRSYESEQAARQAATKPGHYRMSRSENGTRTELEPFTI